MVRGILRKESGLALQKFTHKLTFLLPVGTTTRLGRV